MIAKQVAQLKETRQRLLTTHMHTMHTHYSVVTGGALDPQKASACNAQASVIL